MTDTFCPVQFQEYSKTGAIEQPSKRITWHGKMFRARGRYRLLPTKGEPPYAILEEVTVFGLSLPEGVAGWTEREESAGRRGITQWRAGFARGQEFARVEPGALVMAVWAAWPSLPVKTQQRILRLVRRYVGDMEMPR
jgi:hypothetical protein